MPASFSLGLEVSPHHLLNFTHGNPLCRIEGCQHGRSGTAIPSVSFL